MGGGPYARNAFERQLDQAVTPAADAERAEIAARAEARREADEARKRQELAALRARVGNLPRHPVDYGSWTAAQLSAWIHAQHDEPPDPRVKP